MDTTEGVELREVVQKSILKNKANEAEGLNELFDKMQIKVVGREQGADSDDAIESEEGSVGDIDDELAYMQDDPNLKSSKHVKATDLETRAREDMDFPDEVDTPFTNAAERFQKYRGIKSLRDCDWDPYENLPAEYSKIWRFQSY